MTGESEQAVADQKQEGYQQLCLIEAIRLRKECRDQHCFVEVSAQLSLFEAGSILLRTPSASRSTKLLVADWLLTAGYRQYH